MNALRYLISEHHTQDRLLDQLEEARGSAARQELYDQFRDELVKHVNIEEKIFYPRVKSYEHLKLKAQAALEEHNLIMQLLQELDMAETDQLIWQAKLKVLKDLNQRHVRYEEDELFPLIDELASLEYLEDMGWEMVEHKKKVDPDEVLHPND
jgi:hemerythrin-like domain-containing protein